MPSFFIVYFPYLYPATPEQQEFFAYRFIASVFKAECYPAAFAAEVRWLSTIHI
jgi:hypothetical protein